LIESVPLSFTTAADQMFHRYGEESFRGYRKVFRISIS